MPELVAATTWHGRTGAVRHAFRYRTDFVIIDPEAPAEAPLFGRNRRAVASIHDRDHGGLPGKGEGAAWARRASAERGVPEDCRLLLLTQPRWLGDGVQSGQLLVRDEAARRSSPCVAEVNNTYGDRHSYLCALPDSRRSDPATS